MGKWESFENQNFEKDIYKMEFEKTFSESDKKKSKNVIWPKVAKQTMQQGYGNRW